MEKLDRTSMDLVQENIKKLKEIFPEIFIEGKIDFDLLRQICSGGGVQNTEGSKERYSLTWNGKSKARQIAQEVSTGTLRPAKEESKNWDNTENIYIEGDNLEVLKLLQKSYHGKIKMIYIDPPYNTGKDFVYKDDFTDNIENYKEITGQINKEGIKLTTNTETNGRYHSDWLNMMYPRLKLARNLLTDDGVIFISIDDNEQANLKKICDEIFGEENFVAQLSTIMNLKGNNDEFGFSGTHEFTAVYSKEKVSLKLNNLTVDEEELNDWKEDELGLYKQGANLKSTGVNAPREKRPNLFFPIFIDKNNNIFVTDDNSKPQNYEGELEILYPITDDQEMSWRWSKSKFRNEFQNIIVSRFENNISIYKKQRPTLGDLPSKKPKTVFYKPEYSSGNGTAQIKFLFNKKVFSNPKPIELIKDFFILGTNKNSIVLDFFSGSATTAHSVMQLNAEDEGNRKYIMVQLPELCDESSEAYKAGYKNICEIGKERIRRAGEKIKSDESLPIENREKLDVGFKVFKLDSSNIKEWDTNTEDLQQSLLDSMENVKIDRSSLDILYEILLKYGLDLNIPIEENKNFYSIGGGSLLVSLDKEINNEVINSICEEYKKLLEIDKDFKTTVILRDNSFKNDVDKTNAIKKLEQVGINEIRSI